MSQLDVRDVHGAIEASVRSVLKNAGLPFSALHPETSLTEDLGMDSLLLVDMAMELEVHLGVEEFPLQRWADSQGVGTDGRFTVSSLANLCRELVE